ncbi:MAG: TetR/AcrR family transcriptional regulator [Candidatus Ornithospirochaeta sp.]
MPKIFSEQERRDIISSLRHASSVELALKGVRKTTVDELCALSHIAKGTFYLFYESKEELFLDTLQAFLASLEDIYLEMLQNLDENHIVTSLTKVFSHIAQLFWKEGMYRFLDEENLALIKRKVPEALFRDTSVTMKKMIRNLFSYFSIENEDDIASFEDGYLAILHLFLIPEGVRNMEKTVTFLIRGLVLQLVE